MNVKELTFRGDDVTRLYACGACGSLHSPEVYACRGEIAHQAARRMAGQCCVPEHCACGAALEEYWTACADCRERNMLRRARVIEASGHEGAVCAEVHGEWGEGYSSSISAMLAACMDYGDPVPAYCHPCTEQRLSIDPESLLEGALEDMHEGAEDQVVDGDALVAFVAAWNAKQTCVSYSRDRSRVIILDQERFQALITDAGPGPLNPEHKEAG